MTPAASNHLDQFFQSSRRSNGNFSKSDALVMRLRPETKFGAANWEKPLGTEARGIESGPISIAMTNRKIDILACEVDVLRRRGDAEVDAGMASRTTGQVDARAIWRQNQVTC